ncbi:MAG: M24 family metallopeptidase, partial [Paramuribaculum sp.]|nr:M24 family metallopeptidase [Paramuribaculum sp.]
GTINCFIRRPNHLTGDYLYYIHKPEDISIKYGIPPVKTLALETSVLPYDQITRLTKAFNPTVITNGSDIMRHARAVKTPYELGLIRESGIRQAHVYSQVPHIYREGMTDLELQVELERLSRLEGCLGLFRISGNSMELYMANILVGDNADTPTPYDFAMGGEGLDPSIPVGCNGSIIHAGESVMVDANGNYTGYMTDMTRTFAIGGTLSDTAMKAHRCSIDICHALAREGKPGKAAKELYGLAEEIATDAGLHEYFMGHRQKAGFVGHGVGIEINELPVIAPRSRDILTEGNVIALEPKFVIPGVGAVGIENTYHVTTDGLIPLTIMPEDIISLT